MRGSRRSEVATLPTADEPLLLTRVKTAMSSTSMVERLRREWPYPRQRGWILEDCEVVRVHPRSGRTFILDYEMRFLNGSSETTERFFGELVGEDAEQRYVKLLAKLRRSKRGQLPRHLPTDLVAYVPELGLILRAAGLDEALHGLRPACDAAVMQPILTQHLPVDGAQALTCRAELLRHRLGKRCVIRYRLEAGGLPTGQQRTWAAIGKVYKFRTTQEQDVFAVMQALWDSGFNADAADAIRIPRPFAALSDWQLLLMEEAPGSSLAGVDPGESEPGIALAGRALAKLHRCPVQVPSWYTVEDEVGLLARRVAMVSKFYPEMKARMAEAFRRTQDALTRCRRVEPALVHRDFYEKQVLVNGHETILLDFDTLCLADPAIDVGNFLAHLKLASLQRAGDSRRLEEIFLGGYDLAPSRNLRSRVAAYTQSALLRLACLHAFYPRWNHLVMPLLETCESG